MKLSLFAPIRLTTRAVHQKRSEANEAGVKGAKRIKMNDRSFGDICGEEGKWTRHKAQRVKESF